MRFYRDQNCYEMAHMGMISKNANIFVQKSLAFIHSSKKAALQSSASSEIHQCMRSTCRWKLKYKNKTYWAYSKTILIPQCEILEKSSRNVTKISVFQSGFMTWTFRKISGNEPDRVSGKLIHISMSFSAIQSILRPEVCEILFFDCKLCFGRVFQ